MSTRGSERRSVVAKRPRSAGAASRPMGEHDLAVAVGPAERADRAVAECVRAQGVRLGHVPSAVDRVIEHDQRAQAAGFDRRGDADGVYEVQLPVAGHRGGGSHSAR